MLQVRQAEEEVEEEGYFEVCKGNDALSEVLFGTSVSLELNPRFFFSTLSNSNA